jgi:hypothetical protein
MSDSSGVALIAATISAIAAIVSASLAAHSVSSTRNAAADDVAARFREPVLQAAFNLQSRFYNIVNLNFLQVFAGDSARDDEREYAYKNTLYLLGQYFCWVEILRRESQFLDPRSRTRNREIARHLERVRDAFASSEEAETVLRIFRGNQRAIGEVMLEPIVYATPERPRWECIGYATFDRKMEDPAVYQWFARPRSDLGILLTDPARATRIVLVQHALLDLIHTLDPSAERVSAHMLKPLRQI